MRRFSDDLILDLLQKSFLPHRSCREWRPAPRDGRDHREKENFSKVSVDSVAEQETLMQEVYFQ